MAKEREIGFGIIGLGMGKHHARAISMAKGAKLVAFCDLDEDRLKQLCDEHKVKGYKNYSEMLKDDEVEVVNICTPSGTHADLAMPAVEAGKNVILEKPVDVNLDKINKLIEAGGKAGVKMGSIFQSRTSPMNKAIKAAIDEGRLGRLAGVHGTLAWYRPHSYFKGPHGTWKGTWALDGGGSLMNQGIHTVDLMQWLGGRVKSVFGAFGVFAHNIESEDKTVAVLKFENGALGTLTTTTAAYPGLPENVLVHGFKGTIQKEEDKLLIWKVQGEREKEEEAEMLKIYGPGDEQELSKRASDPLALDISGHVEIMENMVRAILEDRDPMITIEDAKHAVAIVDAIYKSGKTGKEVSI